METDACLAVGWQRWAGTLEELETWDKKSQHMKKELKSEHYEDNLDIKKQLLPFFPMTGSGDVSSIKDGDILELLRVGSSCQPEDYIYLVT